MKQLYSFGKLNLHLLQPLQKNFINLLLQNLKENQTENLNAKRHYKANKKHGMQTLRHITFTEKQKQALLQKRLCIERRFTETQMSLGKGLKI